MSWLDRLLVDDLAGRPGGVGLTLEALSSGLPMKDARELREERAGIMEHEAGMTRQEAERRAGL